MIDRIVARDQAGLGLTSPDKIYAKSYNPDPLYHCTFST